MGKDHITSRINNISEWILDDRVRRRLAGSGFDTIGNFTVQLRNNLALINALLSSYDVTRHCFSFGAGDVLVFFGLEDILFITGLPIDGKPITGNESEPTAVCEKLLGVNMCITRERKKGKVTHTSNVSLDWLKETFMKIPKDVDEQDESFLFYVRGYVLYVIGCLIAPDAGKQVSVIYLPLLEDIDKIKDYAWGASLLAMLHWTFSKNVKKGKELTGFIYALMIFALERIPRVAKKLGYEAAQVKTTKMDYPLFVGWSNLICERTRDNYKERSESEWKTILDSLTEEDIEWKPYERLPSDYLSEFLRRQAILGMSRTVLLCFEKVVYHRPDVSARQFGLGNDFVCTLSDLIEIRPTERSGNNKKDWSSWGKYKLYNEEWGKRYNLLIKPQEDAGTPQCTELRRSRGEGLSHEAAEKLQIEYECQKMELIETRRVLECKSEECQEAWKSLKDLQNELMLKTMHDGSLAFAIEGQVKEKNRCFSFMTDLERKLKLLKIDQSNLSEEALSLHKKFLVDMYEMSSMIESKLNEQVELHNDMKLKFIKGAKERKELYNKILELKGNIRVFCRCRPFNTDEIAAGASMALDFEAARDGELTVKSNSAPKKAFKFDAVFGPKSNQVDVFEDTAPFATSVLDGYNVCLFAYGQTGTGKTFTMEGIDEARGVNFRTLEELFHIIKEREGEYRYKLSVSVVEVYNEQIRDLLEPATHTGVTTKRLEIRQVGEGMHHVPGLVEVQVDNVREVWEVLQTGSNARAVGSTNANEHSSRSHCIHCVMVKGKNLLNGECTRSKLWLVDLAGSERVAKSELQGERLKETQNINRSLSALGDVMFALATKSPHVPFRNSKLTHLLRDSLGGDSKTLMFVHISPNENDLSETICSLNFASRVRGIELGPAKKQVDKGGNSPKELKSGGKKPISSILRQSVQKRVQIKSPTQQHIGRGGGVNVRMD